jgi:hypothetical protein
MRLPDVSIRNRRTAPPDFDISEPEKGDGRQTTLQIIDIITLFIPRLYLAQLQFLTIYYAGAARRKRR